MTSASYEATKSRRLPSHKLSAFDLVGVAVKPDLRKWSSVNGCASMADLSMLNLG